VLVLWVRDRVRLRVSVGAKVYSAYRVAKTTTANNTFIISVIV